MTLEETFISARISRRGFMGATAAATLGALVGREPQTLRAAQQEAAPAATADAVIVLWMAGGMAHTETFDPKKYTPFAPGVKVDQVLSTFPTIDTAVDHIKFTQGLERLARVIDRGTVTARSMPLTSASSCTRGTSTTGIPATFRRSRWPCPISALSSRRRSVRGTRRCRRSSRSARTSRSAPRARR